MESVAQLVQAGNATLRTGERSCTSTPEQTTHINHLLALLRAVNQGEVTFAAPVDEFQLVPAITASPAGPGAARGM
jgi:hypothetical protein